MSLYIDITNKKFGKLTAIKIDHIKTLKTKQKIEYWLCKCECGNEVIVSKTNLLNLHTKSCGCLKHIAYNYSHKMKNTRIYKIWSGIKTRCYNKNSNRFNIYGARNIIMCDDWKNDFMSFYNWAIVNGYNDNLSIDRIDVNGNYEPSNCRWVDNIAQANNRTTNLYITYNNETHSLAEWCRIYKLNYKNSWKKISRGKTLKEIIKGEK